VEIEQSLCAQTSDPRSGLTAEQSQSFDDNELECSVHMCHDVQQQQKKRREAERLVTALLCIAEQLYLCCCICIAHQLYLHCCICVVKPSL